MCVTDDRTSFSSEDSIVFRLLFSGAVQRAA
jgi:hypothetical protein